MEYLMILTCIVIALVSILLVGIILIQQSKGGGFGIAFGGIGESVFGAHAASHLIKITVTLCIIFAIAVLAMNVMSSRRAGASLGDKMDAGYSHPAIVGASTDSTIVAPTVDSTITVDTPAI